MKTLGPRTFSHATPFVLLALGLAAAHLLTGREATTARASSVSLPPSLHGPFHVRSYLGKCLTYGALQATDPDLAAAGTSPVYVQACQGGSPLSHVELVEQDIVVAEFGAGHQVRLRAGDKVIGVAGNFPVAQAPLELQDEDPDAAGQVFALDGDSIILAADRDLVVEVKNGRGASLTPLVLGNRDLDDSEFWTFDSVDGTYKKPTNGFVRVPQETDFRSALADAGWGTVIQIDPDESYCFKYDFPAVVPIIVPAGVTIRGDRRSTRFGPFLWLTELPGLGETFQATMLRIGDDARITGLRLSGPAPGITDSPEPEHPIYASGVQVWFDGPPVERAIVDHNEMAGWPHAAVDVDGDQEDPARLECPFDVLQHQRIRVVRNFLHHNRTWGGGYGVSLLHGGYASIEGNTFLMNRHAIAASGHPQNAYSAWFNLVLSATPDYSSLGWGHGPQHDFDVHGTKDPPHWCGGLAGGAVEIARNTFLGRNRLNFFLRGKACGLDKFNDNVSLQGYGDAIQWCDLAGDKSSAPVHFWDQPLPDWLDAPNKGFESPDPTQRLGVGDFDGDGRDDLFLATGAAWYYAPAGQTEWRYRNPRTETIGGLLFGDFDGDGRTDVLGKNGSDLMVSWGGASEWERINGIEAPISDLAVGNFVGDGRADVLHADGRHWFVSDAGRGPFERVQTSRFRVRDLRFGDFDGDGRTDVFGVVGGAWAVSYAAQTRWSAGRLRSALTRSVAGLVVADFDGDGHADVATSIYFELASRWVVSHDGTGNWRPWHAASVPLDRAAAVGRFDDHPGADALVWDRRTLSIVTMGGLVGQHRYSRWDMR